MCTLIVTYTPLFSARRNVSSKQRSPQSEPSFSLPPNDIKATSDETADNQQTQPIHVSLTVLWGGGGGGGSQRDALTISLLLFSSSLTTPAFSIVSWI